MSRLARLKARASRMRCDILALYLAARDPRVPWYAKTLAALTAAYALSPIDLIPDFIPVLGHIDDLVIVAAAIPLIARLVPDEIMAELQKEAERRLEDPEPRSLVGAIVVVLFWLALAGLIIWLVLRR